MPAYWDVSATTPVDPRVADVVVRLMTEAFGNAGSRTHEYGAEALSEVSMARRRIAESVGAAPEEVVFTSGATEADNLAILGLRAHGESTGRRHLVTTAIEHKAVLEPFAQLAKVGFEVDFIPPQTNGIVDAQRILEAIRDDTLLVSVMHANNETGAIQPIEDICRGLADREAYLHVDAAQTFGKLNEELSLPRIDLLSLSAHKVFGPKGVGALIARRRGWRRPPLEPLTFGGGQERGLRPGTLPVPLIAGFGLAAALANSERDERRRATEAQRTAVLDALSPAEPQLNGDPDRRLPHILNVSFPGADGEAVMLAWRDLVAVSNGSACTSASYQPSHVLTAMNLPEPRVRGAVRLSWWHDAESVDWSEAARRVNGLRGI
ncbi:cysteine desulfurase DndA [Blastococcus sp. SYSU D01042]